jgi:hypothetical protein
VSSGWPKSPRALAGRLRRVHGSADLWLMVMLHVAPARGEQCRDHADGTCGLVREKSEALDAGVSLLNERPIEARIRYRGANP